MKIRTGFFSLLLLASAALATPPNAPSLDGRPLEYDSTDLRASFVGPSAWGANGTLSNLFVTWDSSYLYVALQAWQAGNNKLVVLLDADPGAGTGATSTTNWTGVDPSFIKYNDYGWTSAGGFGLDYMFASEGFYNNVVRVLYDGIAAPSTNNLESLFDNGNGSTPAGTPVDVATRNDASACPHKGFEVRIPWSVLYEGSRWGSVETNEVVPRGASIRLLAGIHNNNPDSAWSSQDTIPNQAIEVYSNGIVSTATYLDVLLDANSDGIPDVLSGDVNAPYIRSASGAMGGSSIFLSFNEPVVPATAQNVANWSVGGVSPSSAVLQGSNSVLLSLASPIASTDLLEILATGVQDASLNSRPVPFCLFPAESGIPDAVAVTFLVNTNSGMGASSDHAKPSAFFVNGGTAPLEWGFPPLENTPLLPVPGSNGWASATVVFTPGTPRELRYKYSGRIDGTNNFEAVRLTGFDNANRLLNLDTNGLPMTVVDYLGAAAHPLRSISDTNLPSAQNRLYSDARRGDPGVRVRREILFRLDLSMRRRDSVSRVMVLGSDPLRGFNSTGNNVGGTASDYPDNSAYLDWDAAGLQLFDDGTHGDETASDGVFSRLWCFSTNGLDSAMEPNAPHSLVGGASAVWFPVEIPGTEPYQGETYWTARRSPRSVAYKFFVLNNAGNHTNSPANDLEYYVEDPAATDQIVLPLFAWDNDFLPPPPPTNAPVVAGVSVGADSAVVSFENVPTEAAHGVRISTNLASGFMDFGHRAVPGATNEGLRQWSATVSQISGAQEFYAPYAGPEAEPFVHHWEPSAVPAGEAVWRIHFSQYKNPKFAGNRAMAVAGTFNGWGETPLVFLGDGRWMADVPLPAGSDGAILEYKFRSGSVWADDPNNKVMRGGPSTWSPDQPVPGELFSVSFDSAGTPLAGATNVSVHLGFDSGWSEAASRPMTNSGGSVWEYSLLAPTNYSQSVNWVFNGQVGAPVVWYSPADWKAFFSTFVNP